MHVVKNSQILILNANQFKLISYGDFMCCDYFANANGLIKTAKIKRNYIKTKITIECMSDEYGVKIMDAGARFVPTMCCP